MTSINSYVSKLKAAINWCVEQDLLHENPWGNIGNSQAQNKPRTGTLEDFPQTLSCAPAVASKGSPKPPLPYVCVPAYPNFSVSNGRHSTGRLEPCAFTCRKFVLQNLYSARGISCRSVATVQVRHGSWKTLVCRGRKGTAVTSSMYHKSWDRACKKSAYLCLCTRYGILLLRNAGKWGGHRSSGCATWAQEHPPQQGILHSCAGIIPTACSYMPPDCTNLVRNGAENNYIINKNNVLSIKAIFLR